MRPIGDGARSVILSMLLVVVTAVAAHAQTGTKIMGRSRSIDIAGASGVDAIGVSQGEFLLSGGGFLPRLTYDGRPIVEPLHTPAANFLVRLCVTSLLKTKGLDISVCVNHQQPDPVTVSFFKEQPMKFAPETYRKASAELRGSDCYTIAWSYVPPPSNISTSPIAEATPRAVEPSVGAFSKYSVAFRLRNDPKLGAMNACQ